MKYATLDAAVEAYCAHLVESYIAFTKDFHDREGFVARFAESLKVKKGRKYIKIVADGSVKAFIVAADNDAKFAKGDLLMPASWAAPARNSARGNVLEGTFSGGWTGPAYLS